MPEAVHAWTDRESVEGLFPGPGRLSDALNSRQPVILNHVTVSDVVSGTTNAAAALQLDPFGVRLILVTFPSVSSAEERQARRVRKFHYSVLVETADVEVRGLVHLLPGRPLDSLMTDTHDLFLIMTDADVRTRSPALQDAHADTVFINRYEVLQLKEAGGNE